MLNSKRVPLLRKSSAGNDCYVKDQASCWEAYEDVVHSRSSYVRYQNVRTAPTADSYVRSLLLQESPPTAVTGDAINNKLAVVTGVSTPNNSVGFYIAQELATKAGMHVILLGKSETNLQRCIDTIQREAKRGIGGDDEEEELTFYKHKYNLASLDSVRTAADFCHRIACTDDYDGKLSVLINHASVGSAAPKLTQDGIEYNTGCNFIATHYFTQLMMPLLTAAATDTYKPRVVQTSSIGHCLGRNFTPHRLVQHPKEGGAPAGYIIVDEDTGTIREYNDEPSLEPETTEPPPPLYARYWQNLNQRLVENNNKKRPAGDISKVGTQVGRSKMAVVADVIHMARLYPQLNITCHHPGVIAYHDNSPMMNPLHYCRQYYSPSQGAVAALRAALDPAMNTAPDLQGAYLHADGNPWTPMQPLLRDPLSNNNQWYTMPLYGKACYEAAEELIAKITEEKGRGRKLQGNPS